MDKLLPALVSVLIMALLSACSTTPTKEVSNNTVKPPPINNLKGSYFTQCNGKAQNISDIIQPIASNMVSQQISYALLPATEWRDCSGNFLRFSSYLAAKCPDQASNLAAPAGINAYIEGGDNFRPGHEKARSSRALAQWYQSQGRFTPIYYDAAAPIGQPSEDLKRNRNRIRVGSVLWFSIGKPRSEDGLNGLFKKRPNHDAFISHMAIVTAVKYDEQGNVSQFEMYHGQNARKFAGITKTHFWQWPTRYLGGGKKEYPPFGYWKQYLVGVGDLLPSI